MVIPFFIANFAAIMKEVTIKDDVLRKAAGEGMDAFVGAFVQAIKETIGGELTAATLGELNSDQITLLAWDVLHEEVMDGGFVQLIHNGYGPFIFKNPFAKAVKLWGMRELSKLVYDAHTLYVKYHEPLEKDCTDDEFMALFEQFPEFDDMDDEFVEKEEAWTEQIARYIDENIDRFAKELIRKKSPVNIRNKKASFEYFFIETFTAGIVLTGTEIKSIRLGKASLVDTYCFITNGELWVRGMNVSPYFYGSYNNHEMKRDRKLLLTRKEIQKLDAATKQTGYTIVPLLVFIDQKGRAKMDIALCKGKKEFDKRQTLKEKEDKREMDRAMKVYR